MRGWLKLLAALTAAAIAVVLFRSLCFAIYTVGGAGLGQHLMAGDRVLVSRWSYGLRTGGLNGLFDYGRALPDSIRRGDIVAFDNPQTGGQGVFVCRCTALPGDTVESPSGSTIVPGRRATCATMDYYWMQSLTPGDTIDSRLFGPVAEDKVIGRVALVVYSHNDRLPFFKGYRRERTLMAVEEGK